MSGSNDRYKRGARRISKGGRTSKGDRRSFRKRVISLVIFVVMLLVLSLLFDRFSDKLPFKLPFNLPWRDNSPVIELSQIVGMDIPDFDGNPYVIVDDNMPDEFSVSYDKNDFDIGVHYSELDSLGRCGVCWGVLDSSMMPESDREGLLETRPSGWNPAKYDDLIEDGFLYNRCHLIGYQFTGETDNKLNLITGTRYLNIDGMLPFENMVAGYIRREDGRVFYRVTPLFYGNELVARYVRMEAYSLDDRGIAVCFDVLLYNAQPGIEIYYSTGESRRAD